MEVLGPGGTGKGYRSELGQQKGSKNILPFLFITENRFFFSPFNFGTKQCGWYVPVKSKKQESLLASMACWQPVILQPSNSSGSLLKASAASDPLTPMQTPVLLPRIAAGFSPESQQVERNSVNILNQVSCAFSKTKPNNKNYMQEPQLALV